MSLFTFHFRVKQSFFRKKSDTQTLERGIYGKTKETKRNINQKNDEVQELIHKSINKKDLSICEEFKKQLNQIIVDSIKTTIEIEDTVPAKKSINSIVKGKENKDLVADFIDEFIYPHIVVKKIFC